MMHDTFTNSPLSQNTWITQIQNVQTLTSAFAKCKNVILFFSINRSKAFQGWVRHFPSSFPHRPQFTTSNLLLQARMVSAPSPDTPRPDWVRVIHWEVSDPFRIQWLCKTAVEFHRIGHLKNSYNDGLPVLVGKDGQEIEEGCGTELLREMEGYVESLGEHQRRGCRGGRGGWGGRGHGGGEGGGGGGYGGGGGWGYGGKRYIKREGSMERR